MRHNPGVSVCRLCSRTCLSAPFCLSMAPQPVWPQLLCDLLTGLGPRRSSHNCRPPSTPVCTDHTTNKGKEMVSKGCQEERRTSSNTPVIRQTALVHMATLSYMARAEAMPAWCNTSLPLPNRSGRFTHSPSPPHIPLPLVAQS